MPSEEYELQTLARFVKLLHVCAGVYIWEFVTTLDFEWEVYTGRRPWRWSFIVYVTTRVLALLCFIISLVGFNLEREFSCNAWLRIVLFTAWFAASSASLLLVLRGVAIWGRDIRIVILTGSFWLVNLAGALYALTRLLRVTSYGLQPSRPVPSAAQRSSRQALRLISLKILYCCRLCFLACFTSAMPHIYGTCYISKPYSGFLQQHLRSCHQWHWVLKISTILGI